MVSFMQGFRNGEAPALLIKGNRSQYGASQIKQTIISDYCLLGCDTVSSSRRIRTNSEEYVASIFRV
jgi:hypothetical protein